jgi:hypothetical protein
LEQELEAAHAAGHVVGQRLLEIEDVAARLEVSFEDLQRENEDFDTQLEALETAGDELDRERKEQRNATNTVLLDVE